VTAHGSHPKTRDFLFSGRRLHKGGLVNETCLSQWYPAPFWVDRLRYGTAQRRGENLWGFCLMTVCDVLFCERP